MTRKITIPVTVELDDDDEVHEPAYEAILAASVDEETALADLGDRLGEQVDVESLIYARYRKITAQRDQVSQQLAMTEDDG